MGCFINIFIANYKSIFFIYVLIFKKFKAFYYKNIKIFIFAFRKSEMKIIKHRAVYTELQSMC